MSDGTREQLILVTFTVNGIDLGTWDSWNGGKKDTSSTRYRSGGDPDDESLGGPNTYTDLTIGRNFRLSRDAPIIGFLLSQAGGVSNCAAVKHYLNRDYTVFDRGLTVAQGPLKTVNDPDGDSQSNNAAMLTVIMEVNSLTVID